VTPESNARRVAIVIGASSGIGEELARQLSAQGWRLALTARRVERLEALATGLGADTLVRHIDVADAESAVATLEALIDELGGADLIVVNSGVAYYNYKMKWALDREVIQINVVGFAAVAQAAMRHFMARGRGHLVGISSIAALRAYGGTAAYCASKSFASAYLDGLRDLAKVREGAVTVTDVQPGFVDTPMIREEKGAFWIAPVEEAVACIVKAINRRAKHVYVTRRWGLIAFLQRLRPRPG
jgi:short-subunit dehydrogenase